MKRSSTTIALFYCAYLSTLPCMAINWGVCGHPGEQQAYNDIPVSTQLSLINSLGAHWYRIGFNESVYTGNPTYFQNLVAQASANKDAYYAYQKAITGTSAANSGSHRQ